MRKRIEIVVVNDCAVSVCTNPLDAVRQSRIEGHVPPCAESL
jgi:hypothetical protein